MTTGADEAGTPVDETVEPTAHADDVEPLTWAQCQYLADACEVSGGTQTEGDISDAFNTPSLTAKQKAILALLATYVEEA